MSLNRKSFHGKNLIYVFADQWRRASIGHYDSAVQTPNIDRFINEGFVFDRAYSTCPVCSPHRACLMSGKYPLNNGVYTNCKPEFSIGLKEEDICIGDALKSAGYHTGYIGKWHLDMPDGSGGWDAYTPPGPRRHGFDFWYSYGTFDEHRNPHYWTTDGERVEVEQWSPDHETDVAIDFLKRQQGEKFALFVSWNPPHSPYDLAPEQQVQKYADGFALRENVVPGQKLGHHTGEEANISDLQETTRGYYASISSLDDNFGRLMDYLRESGLQKDTVVVLSADHGDMMGSHGLMGKYVWYEESVGIPLIFGCGGLPHGQSSSLIGSPDHAPTVLDLLGVPIPTGMMGKSFAPELWSEACRGYGSIYCAGYVNTKQRVEEFQAHGCDPFAYGWRCVIDKRYKLAVHNGYSYGEPQTQVLYDLKIDPLEQHPLQDAEKIKVMREKLRGWLERLNDPFLLEQ